MYSRTTSRHPSQWMNSPGNSSASRKGRLFFWFRRGRDSPRKLTRLRPRRRAPLPRKGCLLSTGGAAISSHIGYGLWSCSALARRSGGCDDRPRRAAPPFGPFGGLVGETDGQDPKLARALARRLIRRRAADKAVVSRVPADELQPSIHGRRASARRGGHTLLRRARGAERNVGLARARPSGCYPESG
jgi:hypothetical protein